MSTTMAYLSSKLMATTAEFVPQLIKKTSDVLDASIVTRHPPDISRNDQIVGICAVPFGRESEDDLGYHFTDFLAFKALYSSLYRENQAWFSQINPEVASKTGSIHGGRDVSSAVKDYNRPITVEPNAQALVGKFMKAIMKSADNTRQHSDTLVIIACGLTSLEQDIYIVDGSDYSAVITSESIRAALDTDIKVIFITPSLTSVGWQVNPSLMHPLEVQSDPIEFMARQCGTIFGHNVVNALRSSGSPFLNRDFADAIPVMKSPVLKDSEAKLHEQGYSRLASRFIPGHGHHSFSFQLENDPWELHIGLRQGIPLTKLADQWAKLDRSESSASNGFSFLGEAFGGTRKSQLAHIDHMFKQSYNSSGYRSGSFVSVQKHFQELRHGAEHDETECHVLFNILEHKMSSKHMLGTFRPFLAPF